MTFTYDTRILWCVPTMVINILMHNICITFSEMPVKVYNIGCFYFWILHKKAWNLKVCLVYSGLRVKDVVLLSLYSSSKPKHFYLWGIQKCCDPNQTEKLLFPFSKKYNQLQGMIYFQPSKNCYIWNFVFHNIKITLRNVFT